MIRLRFSRKLARFSYFVFGGFFAIGIFSLWFAPGALCGSIALPSAQKVALGQIRHHLAIFGSWNGSTSPVIQSHEPLYREGELTAHLFRVDPSGYLIVAANSRLSPVPFYSTRSTFDTHRSDNPNAIESWMVARLNARALAASQIQKHAASENATAGLASSSSRINNAWTYFDRLGSDRLDVDNPRSLSQDSVIVPEDIIRGAAVAPLMTTVWGQFSPYNAEAPDDACASGHTLTGCVATAWAQLLKYWQWPPQDSGGDGSHTYTWNGANVTASLSADFSNTEAFQWTDMPDDLTAQGTTQDQVDAVAKLMYAVGVSAEMDFGCPESLGGSASTRWADEVLDTHFGYQPMDPFNNRLDVSDYTAFQWFSIIKNELDHDPPRPIIFSMGSPGGWHEVVIDGYQEGVADKVHINFGWDGSYDAYYDITDDDDFNTPGSDWDVGYNQVMVIGIEPDNIPPVVQAGPDAHAEEMSNVTLSVVSASDPEGLGVSRYQWSQVSGPAATIQNPESTTPNIITPNVHVTSYLVFQVKAYDVNHAPGTDTCTITVNNTDGSAAPTQISFGRSSSGGSGGCFVTLLNG